MKTFDVYTVVRLRTTADDYHEAESKVLLDITKALPEVVIENVIPLTVTNPQSVEVGRP
jgi:hypothetical protein